MPRGIVVQLIIILNILVYILWVFAGDSDSRMQFMMDHFLVSWDLLASGHLWTLLGSVFSHNMFWHLFMNMFVLNSFGTIVELRLGSARFLRFYLLAGIVSSFSHSWVSAWLLHQPDLPALGASGAVSAVILLFSLMYPKEKILLLGLIPLPAMFAAFLFIGLDIWGLSAQAEGGGLPIGHGAHLGGAATGILYFLAFRRGLRPNRY
ncbi:MAG: hypothetical protein C5B49_03630 [Bdellovibrio sp.]|nr:MAG: hypothetical protein C5B49_03630 [Bdellovibrio sp.]